MRPLLTAENKKWQEVCKLYCTKAFQMSNIRKHTCRRIQRKWNLHLTQLFFTMRDSICFFKTTPKSWKAQSNLRNTFRQRDKESERTPVKVIHRSGDKGSWKESESGPRCCYYRLIYSSGPFYSNSSPFKIRCSELFWWLLWAKCVLLQVLHEIARVRWRGLWCFWVNTSSELFGCWSWGAIRLLSVNPTS